MKVKLLSLLLSLFAVTAFSQTSTNTPATNAPSFKDTAATIAQTNVNQVLVEILSGVKVASGEIYQASKGMIHTGIDFVKEQAPDVFRQFIYWKLSVAGSYLFFWLVAACFCFYVARRFHLYSKTAGNNETGVGMKWVSVIVGLILLLTGARVSAQEMIKIGIAPKVYVIEYVVDMMQDTAKAVQQNNDPACSRCGGHHH